MLAVCNPGDTVLSAAAPWVSYGPIAACASATLVQAQPLENSSLKTSVQDLEYYLRQYPRTKIFILNNPCNPSAQLYSAKEVQELLELCVKSQVYFLLDRLYWKILFQDTPYPAPKIDSNSKEWLIQVDGLSKNFFRLGGLRVGWSLASTRLSEVMSIMQSHHSSGTAVPSQLVALNVLSRPYDSSFLDSLKHNRKQILSAENQLPHVTIPPMQGTYYSFWNVRNAFGTSTPSGQKIQNSKDMASYLLDSHGIVTSPGNNFGTEGYLRLSYAVAPEIIEGGLLAAKKALSQLSA